MRPFYFVVTSLLAGLLFVGCSAEKQRAAKGGTLNNIARVNGLCPSSSAGQSLIRYDYKEGEILELCDKAIAATEQKLMAIQNLAPDDRNFVNTMLAFETATAELSDATSPLSFMGSVSTDANLREEGSACEEKVGQYHTEINSRKPLYEVIKGAIASTAEESRLTTETLKSFIKSGMNLDDATLAKTKELFSKINKLQTDFSKNLNEDVSTVVYTLEELKGAPADFVSRLKKNEQGDYVVTTKEPDYVAVMENVDSSAARKKMLTAYDSRQQVGNTPLLLQTIELRRQVAKLMGYNTWADYQLDGRMAKDVTSVKTFLGALQNKLSQRNQADFQKLLAYKITKEPSAKLVDAWDIRYLAAQIKKRDFSIDEEKISEFFPANTVIDGMFSVYSQLLGVDYVPLKSAKNWNADVLLYEIHNKSDCQLIGYFYADLVPREGKYGHAAAFPLISGRQLANGDYQKPIASIVANLNPPTGNKPSLLSHDDVETLFHEFGHIMHQTLTKAPYASLSGSSVAQDFVEAPSQMLESWVWDPEILPMLSGHYLDANKKLPKELLEQMIRARDFNQGYKYTRQLLFALFDMEIHSLTEPPTSANYVNDLYLKMHNDIIGIPATEGTSFPGTFGHLMGGYDAGYYGYLWSEVYAMDMFTRFDAAPKRLLDSGVGMLYRNNILEFGGMIDPLEILRRFLGREPNSDAFYKRLNISN